MVAVYRAGILLKAQADPRAPIEEVADPSNRFFEEVARNKRAVKIDVVASGKWIRIGDSGRRARRNERRCRRRRLHPLGHEPDDRQSIIAYRNFQQLHSQRSTLKASQTIALSGRDAGDPLRHAVDVDLRVAPHHHPDQGAGRGDGEAGGRWSMGTAWSRGHGRSGPPDHSFNDMSVAARQPAPAAHGDEPPHGHGAGERQPPASSPSPTSCTCCRSTAPRCRCWSSATSCKTGRRRPQTSPSSCAAISSRSPPRCRS